MVGMTALSCSSLIAERPVRFEWQDTIDAWEGLCDAEAALVDADSLKLPCLVGPGARRPPQLDAIAAGTGRMRVARVTDYSNSTGAGTLRSAIDSAQAWDDGSTCTAIVFVNGGGDVYFNDSSGDQNSDDLECVYVLGQTAQGEGINILGDDLRARRAAEWYFGYFYQRKAGEDEGFAVTSSSDMMCSSGLYVEHLSNSWYARTSGENLMTQGCGTAFVPQAGVLTRDITFSRNLLFEPHVDHSTFMHIGGDTSEVGGVAKTANLLYHANYMASGGHRTPLVGNADSVQIIDNVVYNARNAYVQIGSTRKDVQTRVDVLNNYFRTGPYTSTGPTRRWAFYLWLLDGDDSVSVQAGGLRTEQNGYDSLSTPMDLHRGRSRSTACLSTVENYSGHCATDGDPIPPETYAVTDTMALGLGAARPEIASLTDAKVSRIIQIAGNSRYLACDGTWTLRSDSVDARARAEWVDGAGVREAEDLRTETTRAYGTPASGTACSDADADGLPDQWEFGVTGDSMGIAPDSISNGLPAILWYASGRDLAGALMGCAGCSAETGGAGTP
jgi:hypothetical protein